MSPDLCLEGKNTNMGGTQNDLLSRRSPEVDLNILPVALAGRVEKEGGLSGIDG